MDLISKKEIGIRLRSKRESAGYTRERLGQLCKLSPRFIANIESGNSTFSLDSLMAICRVLSCSSDYLLFGFEEDADAWSDTVSRLQRMDIHFKPGVDKLLQTVIEIVLKAG